MKMLTSCSGNSRYRGGFEENILAFIDGNDSKDTQDANDDRIIFLQAVRAASLDQDDGVPPTKKMCEAVFQVLRDGKSLELMMESFQLLNEIDKRFPRVYLSDEGAEPSQLMVAEEAWSPFIFNLDVAPGEKDTAAKCSAGLYDSLAFNILIQDLAEVVNATNPIAVEMKSLEKMLIFQYLINVLEGDFVPRNKAYEETMNWTFAKESLLNKLLISRRINFKAVMKNCLSILCELCQACAEDNSDHGSSDILEEKTYQHGQQAIMLALPEVKNATCVAMQKLLTMNMDLDMSRKKADAKGSTTRADGVRTPLMEIILDELTYDSDMLSPFLQAYNEPKWKLEIILQYFAKYSTKPSVRTRRSNDSVEQEDDRTLIGILKRFSNVTSTKIITKKISKDVVQILLAHAFQAQLSLPSAHREVECNINSKDNVKNTTLVELCENLISAYDCLKSSNGKMEILPVGKEALFTAAAILSMNV